MTPSLGVGMVGGVKALILLFVVVCVGCGEKEEAAPKPQAKKKDIKTASPNAQKQEDPRGDEYVDLKTGKTLKNVDLKKWTPMTFNGACWRNQKILREAKIKFYGQGINSPNIEERIRAIKNARGRYVAPELEKVLFKVFTQGGDGFPGGPPGGGGNFDEIAIKRKSYVELLLQKGLLTKINNDDIYTVKSPNLETIAEGKEAGLMGKIYDNIFPENENGEAIVKLGELAIENLMDSRDLGPAGNQRLGAISRAGQTKDMGQMLSQDIQSIAQMIYRTKDPVLKRALQDQQRKTFRKQMLWAVQNAAQNYIETPENQKNLRMAALAQLQQLVSRQVAFAKQYGINYQLGNMRQMFIEDWGGGDRDAITCKNWINVDKALEDMFGITNLKK